LKSSVQHILILVDAYTGTSAWGWVPIMLYRLIMPSGSGVCFTFSLEDNRQRGFEDHGYVIPEVWVLRCLQVVAAIMAFGGVFSHVWEFSDSSQLRLFLALREKPYAYFGAPTYLCATGVLLIGLGLQVVQRRLVQGTFPRAMITNAAVLFLGMFGCILYILDRADFSWIFFVLFQVAFVTWVATLSWYSLDRKGIGKWALAYISVGVVFFITTIITQWWFMYYFYLAWMCLYGYAVPDGPKIYITSCNLACNLDATSQCQDRVPSHPPDVSV